MEAGTVVSVHPAFARPVVALGPTAERERERAVRERNTVLGFGATAPSYLVGEESQICLFGVCLLIT